MLGYADPLVILAQGRDTTVGEVILGPQIDPELPSREDKWMAEVGVCFFPDARPYGKTWGSLITYASLVW